jgi:Holliday junction resolvase RusA-like endonuclease
VKITLPYPPATNNLYATVRGRRVKTQRCRDFHADVHALALEAGIKRMAGELSLSVDIYRPRRSGDLDNTLKIIQDSLTGLAWDDDSQVVEIHARRFDDKDNPRAVITIQEVTR